MWILKILIAVLKSNIYLEGFRIKILFTAYPNWVVKYAQGWMDPWIPPLPSSKCKCKYDENMITCHFQKL